MDPYYVSAGKIAFIAATAGDRKSSVETTTATAKAVASMTPSAEGTVAHQVVASASDVADPAVALGQLASVVRALEPQLVFGSMQNEGASKGILVTTSGYGPTSFEFASGKPIELIDGSNLLYLLRENAGIEARIVADPR